MLFATQHYHDQLLQISAIHAQPILYIETVACSAQLRQATQTYGDFVLGDKGCIVDMSNNLLLD